MMILPLFYQVKTFPDTLSQARSRASGLPPEGGGTCYSVAYFPPPSPW